MKKIDCLQILLMIFMFLITLMMIVPLLNILARSLSDPSVSLFMNGLNIFPKKINFINYEIIFNHPVILTSLKNSIFVTLVGTLINIVLTVLAAYTLTRKDLVLKKAIMVFLIIMMLFDPGLVPEYLQIQNLGLMGSQWSVILVLSVNVYYLIIMMRFFSEIPIEMFEAAYMDGANHIQIIINIVFPIAKAGIATIIMFYAVVRWNEYFKAGIYITEISKTTMPVILRQFIILNDTAKIVGVSNVHNYNSMARVDLTALKNATIIVALIPIMFFYPFILKFYNKDILAGGIKE